MNVNHEMEKSLPENDKVREHIQEKAEQTEEKYEQCMPEDEIDSAVIDDISTGIEHYSMVSHMVLSNISETYSTEVEQNQPTDDEFNEKNEENPSDESPPKFVSETLCSRSNSLQDREMSTIDEEEFEEEILQVITSQPKSTTFSIDDHLTEKKAIENLNEASNTEDITNDEH